MSDEFRERRTTYEEAEEGTGGGRKESAITIHSSPTTHVVEGSGSLSISQLDVMSPSLVRAMEDAIASQKGMLFEKGGRRRIVVQGVFDVLEASRSSFSLGIPRVTFL